MPSKPSFPPPLGCAPESTTSSTSAVETVEGTHIFHISGYSLLRDLGDRRVQSGTFSVGGYEWCMSFNPDGPDCSFHTVLVSDDADVRASFTFGLVYQSNRLTRWCRARPPMVFRTTGGGPSAFHFFIEKRKLEALAVLGRDRFTVACTVAVIKDPSVSFSSPSKAVSGVEVPPPDLPICLRRLLEEGEGADVTFSVREETFSAHRIVLAMRSPVFKAELYGSMSEERTRHVTIEDMQPAVFKALLHFIYTDSLPAMDALDMLDKKQMICHLLVAADRYAMERLNIICQGILCNTLTVENVVGTLALADQHNCSMLKDACMGFIFSANRLGDVVESKEFVNLKTTCPSVLVEILERSSKFTKI